MLYFAVGSKIVELAIGFETNYSNDTMDCGAKLKATGSLSIITAIVYLVDGIFVFKEIMIGP